MTRTSLITGAAGALLLALPLAACRGNSGDVTEAGDPQAPPPAAALYAAGSVTLEKRLEQLERDLIAVLEGELDDESQAHLLSAEATTDRLLEDQPSTEWLPTGYFVEARLRQIQALADRVVAELRRGVAEELVLEDVAALRIAVRDLRERLATARTAAAPAPLDSLLAGYDNDHDGLGGVPASSSTTASTTTEPETTTSEPVAAPEGGPLGQPIAP
ncbi:MAG TPA: hypothetical protein VF039_11175 [Longimicrobiales bacterium]